MLGFWKKLEVWADGPQGLTEQTHGPKTESTNTDEANKMLRWEEGEATVKLVTSNQEGMECVGAGDTRSVSMSVYVCV